MKRLLFILLILWQGLNGADKVTTTKSLQAGQKVLFYPRQGDSFSVQKDLTRLVPGANYDIMMKNGVHVYFDNRGENDDMYIIFNEPLADGDVIVLKVNEGYFTYTTSQIKALPKTVKKILKASAKRKVKKEIVKKSDDVQISTEEFCFDNRGEIVECTSPKALVNQKRESKPATVALKKEAPDQQEEVKPLKAEPQEELKERKNNFFTTFTQKLKAALEKIKTTLAKEREEREKEVHSSEKVAETTAERANRRNTPLEKALVPEKEPPTPDAINRFATDDNRLAEQAKGVQKPLFTAIPLKETDLRFAHAEVDTKSLPKPQISTTEPLPKSAQNDRLDTFSDTTKPDLNREPKKVEPESLPVDIKIAKPTLQAQTALSEPVIKPAPSKLPKSLDDIIKQTDTTPLPRVGIPVQPSVKKETLSLPKVQKESISLAKDKKQTSAALKHTPQQGAAASTVAAVEEKESEAPVTIAQTQAYNQPVTPSQQLPATEKPQLSQQESVQPQQETLPPPQSEPGKIVITKIINKNQKSQPAAEAPISMRDRMLGGGYSEQQNSGKLAVSAYANRKPVSAWVEVYKDKRRVKTFYSGAKKSVRLPEGTYILKATYRMGTSKQKKNLGRVRLKAGESIRKKVYFSIGTLNIVAKKGGKPLYVKVEIYKKGSRSRYAYTFSSRGNGIAHLQLGQGRYKIVVIDHGKKKVLDNVYVKGNSVKTLTVEF